MKTFQLLSNNIIKSPNDSNLYRSILLPNNLKCLLISDPETKRCAAAMHVGVGAQEDPLEYQGLAHFCEHMLFLGSKSFPVQNHYKDFVISNGGSSNAATGGTYTYYHFNIESTKFFQALEIWSKFFTEPLFTADCVGKEINNVNSESVINVSDDSRRQYQVFKDICNHKSVLYRYNCGNLETLDKPGVRDALLEFHSKHYSANQMGLVLCGNQNLDELSEIAAEHFSAITDKQLATIDYSGHMEKPFTPGVNLSKFVEILPIKTVHTLKIQFIFPPMLIDASEKNKPYSYLGHLIGHEGDGSLYAKLIGEGLITSLSAGGSDEESGLYGSFSITTRLTQTGVANWQRILMLTGLYIEMLKAKGLQKWVFDEKKDILEMGFRFKEKSAAQTMVTNLQAMYRRVLDPNMEDILNYHYKMEAYDEPELTRILNEFKVENALITLVDKGLESRPETYDGSTKAYEPIHDNTYWVRSLSPEEISMFQNPTSTLQTPNPNPDPIKGDRFLGLDFPKKNQFIPKDFTIFPQIGAKNSNPCEDPAKLLTSFPIKIWDTEKSSLWFHQDDQFLLPKIKGSMTIYCGMLGGLEDHRQKILAAVWKSLLNEFSSDVTYAADCAGFHIGFGTDNTH
jgi:insulysin